MEEDAVEEEARYSLAPWALEEELAVGPDTEILSLCVPQPINNILSVLAAIRPALRPIFLSCR